MVRINNGTRESLVSIYKAREFFKRRISNILKNTGIVFGNPEFDCMPNAHGELIYDVFYYCDYHERLLQQYASIASLIQSQTLPNIDSAYTAKNSTAIYWSIKKISSIKDSLELASKLTEYSNNYNLIENRRGQWRIGKVTGNALIFYFIDSAREPNFSLDVFYNQAIEAQKINYREGIPDYHKIFQEEGYDFIYNDSTKKSLVEKGCITNKKAVILPSNFNDLSLKSKNKLLLMGLGYKLYDGKRFNKIQVAEKIAILKKINSISNQVFGYRPFTSIERTIKEYINILNSEFEDSEALKPNRRYDLRILIDDKSNVIANVMLNNRIVEYFFVNYIKNNQGNSNNILKGIGTFLLADLLENITDEISGSFSVKSGYNGENIEYLIKGCGFAAATRLPNCEMLPQFTQNILGFPNGFMLNTCRLLEERRMIPNTSIVHLIFNANRNN